MEVSADNWYISNMIGIKNYNLYGERNDFPDVVHCETIETRSLIHDWEFSPHRHSWLHQFLLVESGGGNASIEERQHTLFPGDLINIPVGTVHGFRFKPGTTGWVVTLASELVEEGLLESEGLRPFLMTSDIVKYGHDIKRITGTIFTEYPRRSFARAHVLRALSTALAGLVARALAGSSLLKAQTDHTLQRRFEALLEDHFTSHLGVADYADLLSVTPTHLSRVMRAATGHSALAAIEARVVREARRNLAFSNLSVAEIGYQLGFNDPAYFSRVFKRATGRSPRAFRKGLEGSGSAK